MTETQQKTGLRVKAGVLTAITAGLAILAAVIFFLPTRHPAPSSCLGYQPTAWSAAGKSEAQLQQLVNIDSQRVGQFSQKTSVARKRQVYADQKSHLIDLAHLNPQAALEKIKVTGSSNISPDINPDCQPEYFSGNGILTSAHSDSFEDHSALNSNILTRPDGSTIEILLSGSGPDVADNASVQIQGWAIDPRLVLATDWSVVPGPSPDTESSLVTLSASRKIDDGLDGGSPPPYTTLRTLVVLAVLGTSNTTRASASSYVSFMDGIRDRYWENSYHKTQFAGFQSPTQGADVLGWYQWSSVPAACYTVSDFPAIAQNQLAGTVDFALYDKVIFVSNFGACGWNGQSSIGGKYTLIPDTGPTVVPDYVVIHELGHTLGGDHGNSCGAVSIGCTGPTIVEYGDLFDPLGAIYNGHFNAAHKTLFKWLDSSSLKTISESGAYTIAPLESQAAGVKALRIPRAGQTASAITDYLYLEYRQGVVGGVDTIDKGAEALGGGSDIFQGAFLHTLGPGGASTLLVDPSPTNPASTTTSVTLHQGQSLTDPLTGTVVTVASLSNLSLTVNIDYHVPNFAPDVSLISPTNNQSISGTTPIVVNASDPRGITQVIDSLYLSGDPFSATGRGFTLPAVTVADQPGGSTYTFPWDTTRWYNGPSTLRSRAYNTVGLSSSTNNVTVVVNNPDSVNPTVSLTSPGQTAGQLVHFSASAGDNVGVYGMQFYLDGDATNGIDRAPCYFSAAPYTCSKDIAVGAGTHTVTVKVRDYAGNQTSAQASFTVVDTTGPVVGFTVPAAGAYVRGTITLAAAASDPSGMQRVEFYRDSTLLTSILAPAYPSYSWSSTSTTDGPHTLKAIAYDTQGNFSQTTVTVTVDNAPPTVIITQPTSGAQVTAGAATTISATAADSIGLKNVDFSVNGSSVCLGVVTAPYVCTWNVPTGVGLTYSIVGLASDLAGNKTYSTAIQVTSH